MASLKPKGRPLKFPTPEELQSRIDEYFESCFEEQPVLDKMGRAVMQMTDEGAQPLMMRVRVRPWTISGLAVALDTNRQTLLEYQGEVEGREKSKEYADTITRAKDKIHAFAEESLWTPKIATGVIFNMKNNYGWKDKTEQDVTVHDMTAAAALFDDDEDDDVPTDTGEES